MASNGAAFFSAIRFTMMHHKKDLSIIIKQSKMSFKCLLKTANVSNLELWIALVVLALAALKFFV